MALFELLLAHSDVRVPLAAMQAWAEAEHPISMDRGLSVLQKMLSLGLGADRK